jgi:hypothetical protein
MSNRLYRIEYKYTNIIYCSEGIVHPNMWPRRKSLRVRFALLAYTFTACCEVIPDYQAWHVQTLWFLFFPLSNMQKNMQCLSMHWISETASWHSHRQFFYVWGAVAGAWRFKLNFVWLQSNLKPVFFFRFVPVGQLWATSIFDLHRLTRRWSEMTILRLTQFILQLSPAFSLSPSKMDAGHQCGCSMALKPVALIQLNHIETCWTIKGVICQPIAAASMSWYPEVVGWSG